MFHLGMVSSRLCASTCSLKLARGSDEEEEEAPRRGRCCLLGSLARQSRAWVSDMPSRSQTGGQEEELHLLCLRLVGFRGPAGAEDHQHQDQISLQLV